MELLDGCFHSGGVPAFDDFLGILGPFSEAMGCISPDLARPAAGDVLSHTRRAWELLCQDGCYLDGDGVTRRILCLSALLQGIGLGGCHDLSEARQHGISRACAASQAARTFLWGELRLCGTSEGQRIRESVCQLIRHHYLPIYGIRSEGIHGVVSAAANGQLLQGLNLRLLCSLAEADVRAHGGMESLALLDEIARCRDLAKALGCYESPYDFQSAFSRYAYFHGERMLLDQLVRNDSWGEVVMMCGLPGTGKDTWLCSHCGDLPMVSLDELRKEFRISPKEDQRMVVHAAKKLAADHLMGREPFVWNATNLTAPMREELVKMFVSYGASVRIVYLETEWEEELRRNRNREMVVPEPVIVEMRRRLSPPEIREAHHVEWHCV